MDATECDLCILKLNWVINPFGLPQHGRFFYCQWCHNKLWYSNIDVEDYHTFREMPSNFHIDMRDWFPIWLCRFWHNNIIVSILLKIIREYWHSIQRIRTTMMHRITNNYSSCEKNYKEWERTKMYWLHATFFISMGLCRDIVFFILLNVARHATYSRK